MPVSSRSPAHPPQPSHGSALTDLGSGLFLFLSPAFYRVSGAADTSHLHLARASCLPSPCGTEDCTPHEIQLFIIRGRGGSNRVTGRNGVWDLSQPRGPQTGRLCSGGCWGSLVSRTCLETQGSRGRGWRPKEKLGLGLGEQGGCSNPWVPSHRRLPRTPWKRLEAPEGGPGRGDIAGGLGEGVVSSAESGNAGVRQSKETPKLSKHEEEQTEHPGCPLRGPGQKHGLGLGQNGPRLSPSSHRQGSVPEGFQPRSDRITGRLESWERGGRKTLRRLESEIR